MGATERPPLSHIQRQAAAILANHPKAFDSALVGNLLFLILPEPRALTCQVVRFTLGGPHLPEGEVTISRCFSIEVAKVCILAETNFSPPKGGRKVVS